MFVRTRAEEAKKGWLGIGDSFLDAEILIVSCPKEINLDYSFSISLQTFWCYYPKGNQIRIDGDGEFCFDNDNWGKLDSAFGFHGNSCCWFVPFMMEKGDRVETKIKKARKLFEECFHAQLNYQIAQLEKKREKILGAEVRQDMLDLFHFIEGVAGKPLPLVSESDLNIN